MGQILLTPEEKALAVADEIERTKSCPVKFRDYSDIIAEAQLKKVRKKIAVVEIPMGKSAGYYVDGKPYIALAMLKEDWQALLEELEDRKEEGG